MHHINTPLAVPLSPRPLHHDTLRFSAAARACHPFTLSTYLHALCKQPLPLATATMPILSGRFRKRSRQARSSPEHDYVSPHTPRATASSPCAHTPPRLPSPLHTGRSPPDSSCTPTPSHLEELWTLLDGSLADLDLRDEAFNPDMHSPNDMLVDTEEHIVEPTANGDEKDNLTIINPDNLETEAEQPELTRADDRMLSG